MEERTRGIILRTRPLTETSLIVHWLTPEAGRVATVARGARRPKSPFLGKLDLFFLADFSFARSRRGELHNLREVNVREFFPALRRELAAVRHASYFAHLVEQTTETETPLPGIFSLLQAALEWLATHPPQVASVFAFELKLLRELGLQPDISSSRLHPGTREMLGRVLESDWAWLERLRWSEEQRREAREYLGEFLAQHLGRIPASRAGALQPG